MEEREKVKEDIEGEREREVEMRERKVEKI